LTDNPLILFPAFLFAFVLVTYLSVCIHELGHALVALSCTKGTVAIYIGTYGIPKNCFSIPAGRLQVWILYNPFCFRGGMCRTDESITLRQQTTYALFGPLFSLLACITLIVNYNAIISNWPGLTFLLRFAVILAATQVVYNLVPHKIKRNGQVLYTDGLLAIQGLKYRRFSETHAEAVKFYLSKQYDRAAPLFSRLLNEGMKEENIYRLCYTSFFMIKDYEKGEHILKELMSKYKTESNDYYNLAYIRFRQGDTASAEDYMNKSLELNENNYFTLNLTGYMRITEGRSSEAIEPLDKAIEIDKNSSYAWNNRGHAKMEMGRYEEGLADVEHALQLLKENAYV